MVRNTRRLRTHHKRSYRRKTQKGGFTPQLIAEISAQISSRLGTILGNLLSRSEASGSATLATRSIAETGTAAAESLISALQKAVQQAVSKNPTLAGEAPAITNEILTSATARLAQSASATAVTRGVTAAAAAMAGTAATALTTSASAVAAALGTSLATAARNPETGRVLLRLLRSRVLPSIQQSIQSLLRSGRSAAAREAAVLLQSSARAGIQSGLTSFGRAAAARPGPLTSQLLGLQRMPYGMKGYVPSGTRGFASQAERTAAQRVEGKAVTEAEAKLASEAEAKAAERARTLAEGVESGASTATQEAVAETAAEIPAKGVSRFTVYSAEQIEKMSRTELQKLWEHARGKELPKGYLTKTMKKEVAKNMEALSQKQKNKFGFSQSPPPKVSTQPLADKIVEGVKDAIKQKGGTASEVVAVEGEVAKLTQQIGNMADLTFRPSPQFAEVITNPQAMEGVLRGLPAVEGNGSSFVMQLLEKTVFENGVRARATGLVQLSPSNVQAYTIFGGKQITAAEVAAYNNAVKESMKLLLEKIPKNQVENLIKVLKPETMHAFRTGFFDYFLTSPQNAMNALNTIVNQVIPHMRLTPGAMDRIITTLQHNPNDLSTVLTQIVGQRSVAQQEVSFASQLWRERGIAQTIGRYSVLGAGASVILFLAAFYGISSPYDLVFQLRQELHTIGLSDTISSSIDTLDRFYDGLMYAVTSRNVENGISNGVIAPATGVFSAISSRWSNFMQAGRARTIFETLRNNFLFALSGIYGQYALMFAGAAVVGSIIYKWRKLRIDAENARLAAAAADADADAAQLAEAAADDDDEEGDGALENNNNVPNLPQGAIQRAIAPNTVAAVPRANLAAAPSLPANTNNW
jgi:hypothetical protein